MDVPSLFGHIPFNNHLGLEITSAENGTAAGHLELAPEHSSHPDQQIVHGGVTYSLADTVAGAAVVSLNHSVTPTIDMRIDYLAPAVGSALYAEAEVLRNGENVATVAVDVTDDDGTKIATARGVYKTGGGDGSSAWQAPDDSTDTFTSP